MKTGLYGQIMNENKFVNMSARFTLLRGEKKKKKMRASLKKSFNKTKEDEKTNKQKKQKPCL